MSFPSGPEQEPSLAALVATVAALDRHVERAMIARDRKIEQRFVASDRLFQVVTSAAKEAVEKAEAANGKRFESVNEFRAQLSDQAAMFQPKVLADQQFSALNQSIGRMHEDMVELRTTWAQHLGEAGGAGDTRDDSRAELSVKIATAAVIVAVVLGSLNFLLGLLPQGGVGLGL